MSSWPSAKARRVFAALKRIGWRHDRTIGSHKIMKKDGWADYPFSFHDSEELGPAILAKISKKTGLQASRLVTNRQRGFVGKPLPGPMAHPRELADDRSHLPLQ